MIGLSISKIYLHSNESELVNKMEDFILVLPYFQKSAIWAHCAPWEPAGAGDEKDDSQVTYDDPAP